MAEELSSVEVPVNRSKLLFSPLLSGKFLPGRNVPDSVVELFSLGLSLVTSVLPVVRGSLVVDSELVVETGSG